MGTLNNLTFRRESENNLILISVWVDKDPLTFAIDTGATHSVIDLSQLIIMGCTVFFDKQNTNQKRIKDQNKIVIFGS